LEGAGTPSFPALISSKQSLAQMQHLPQQGQSTRTNERMKNINNTQQHILINDSGTHNLNSNTRLYMRSTLQWPEKQEKTTLFTTPL
jgi:hypothetical protein